MNTHSFTANQFPDARRSLSGKRVLITGASGFIGSHLQMELSNYNVEIHATSRSPQKSEQPKITWWEGSFQDYVFAETVFKEVQPHIVFHLSGDVTAANGMSHVLSTYHSLLTSTLNILTLADKTQCERIVLTGSSTEPLVENPVPNSPYAAAKWATNMYGRMFQNIYHSPVVMVRPFMGYGPAQPAGKIIPFVIHSFLNNKAPQLSNGYWLTDWVYIKDTIEGIIAASISTGCEGLTIDLGSGTLTSVREVVNKITDIMQPECLPVFGALPDRHQEHTRTADTELAYQKLNWRASTQLEKGLKETVNWYRQLAVLFGVICFWSQFISLFYD